MRNSGVSVRYNTRSYNCKVHVCDSIASITNLQHVECLKNSCIVLTLALRMIIYLLYVTEIVPGKRCHCRQQSPAILL